MTLSVDVKSVGAAPTMAMSPLPISTSHRMGGTSGKRMATPFRASQISSPQNPYAKWTDAGAKSIARGRTVSRMGERAVSHIRVCSEPEHAHPTPAVHQSQHTSRRGVTWEASVSGASASYKKNEGILDDFLTESSDRRLFERVEELVETQLSAPEVTFWQDIPGIHALFSPRKNVAVGHSEGLVGYTFFAREKQVLENPSEHPAYREELDKSGIDRGVALYFPLWDNVGNICAVVQVARQRTAPFTNQAEMEFIDYFTDRFRVFHQMLYRIEHPHDNVLAMMHVMQIEEFLITFQKQMEALCGCRIAEIWRFDQRTKDLVMYQKTKQTVDVEVAGIVGEAVTRRFPLNCRANKMMSSYNATIDGEEVEAVMVVPIVDIKRNEVYAISVRGGKRVQAFTTRDETILRSVSSYVILSLRNLEAGDAEGIDRVVHCEHKCVEMMAIAMDMVRTNTPINDVVTDLMEKLEVPLKADRSSLFTLDRQSMCLVSQYHSGCDEAIVVQNHQSFAMRCYSSGEIYNIANCYADASFDVATDLTTGYRTRSVLAMPLKDSKGTTMGVVEFLNRNDGKPFPQDEVRSISVVTGLIGLLLEVQKMTESVSASSKGLRESMAVSLANCPAHVLHRFLGGILCSLRAEVGTESAAIFITLREQNVMQGYVSDGARLQTALPLDHGIGSVCFKSKEVVLSNNTERDPRIIKDPLDMSGIVVKSLLMAPIASDTQCFGVIKLANLPSGVFTNDHVAKLRAFADLVAVSLEKRDVTDLSGAGLPSFEMALWIEADELLTCDIPRRFIPNQSTVRDLDDVADFSVYDWPGIQSFGVVFHAFKKFGLLDAYSMRATTLFEFLYHVKESSALLPFHNFERVIDNIQLVAFELTSSQLTKSLSTLEMLVLFVAVLASDLEHGTENADEEAEAASQRLLSAGSVTDTLRFSRISTIISTSRLLNSLPPEDIKTFWEILADLLASLATDRYYSMLELLSHANPFNPDEESDRRLALSIMLKIGTFSYVMRSPESVMIWSERLDREMNAQDESRTSTSPVECLRMRFSHGQLHIAPFFMMAARFITEIENLRVILQKTLKMWSNKIIALDKPRR